MRTLTGLRGRMLLALVATSLATLGVTGLAVLPRLQRRVEIDRVDELRGLARTIRPELRDLPLHARHAGSPELTRLVARLQRRAGGRIIVYDSAGAELADTLATHDEEMEGPALREAVSHRHDGVASGQRGGVAYAVTVGGEPQRLTLVITKRLDSTRVVSEVISAALPIALAAGLAVSLALAAVVSGGLLRKLGRLRSDAEVLGADGLGHAVRVDGRDEVAVVARALEDMRERLVEEQVSRQEFVSTASHELRTPLASLQVTLELLREELESGTASIDRADAALRQTHRLTALAADLLDISRIDGGTPLTVEPLELGEVAAGVAQEFAPRLPGLTVDGNPALALADPTAVVRIIRVLLDNAANYGAGRVRLTVRPEPRRVCLAVEDEGPGFSDQEREHVFARFARGRAAGGTRGAGLGLAIARGLARAMDGDLEAEPAPGGARLVLAPRRLN